MTRAPKIQTYDSEQFQQDYANIKDPSLRRKLMRELAAVEDELQASGAVSASREDSEIAGWPGYHFAYLTKPHGLVYKFEDGKLYLGRIALDGDILDF